MMTATEFEKQLRTVRRHLRRCKDFMYAAHLTTAYAEAEAAQHAAFDLKQMIADTLPAI